MTEAKTIVTEKGLTTQDRLDKMIDAILTLRGLGLEPTGFTMDADTLTNLCPVEPTGKALKHYAEGWFFLEDLLDPYDFSIMGIPIEPDFGGSYQTAERLEKPQFVEFADESLWGAIENIVRFGSEDFDGSNGVML